MGLDVLVFFLKIKSVKKKSNQFCVIAACWPNFSKLLSQPLSFLYIVVSLQSLSSPWQAGFSCKGENIFSMFPFSFLSKKSSLFSWHGCRFVTWSSPLQLSTCRSFRWISLWNYRSRSCQSWKSSTKWVVSSHTWQRFYFFLPGCPIIPLCFNYKNYKIK